MPSDRQSLLQSKRSSSFAESCYVRTESSGKVCGGVYSLCYRNYNLKPIHEVISVKQKEKIEVLWS